MSARPRIGLIAPPAGGAVPPECTELYGDAAHFDVASAALRALDLESYAEAEARLPGLAAGLAADGAEAVVLMGTSMSFHGGRAHALTLQRMIATASARPATTMSAAIVAALQALGLRRVALATAYIGEVNDALVAFLGEWDIEVACLAALKIHEVSQVAGVDEERLVALGREAWRGARDADGVFISCGGLQTLGATTRLEAEIGRPVVSSAVAGAWAAASATGLDARRPGRGMLLETPRGLPAAFLSRPDEVAGG